MNLRMRVPFGFPDGLAHQAGAKSKSSLFAKRHEVNRTTQLYLVHFNGLSLLARWRSLSERNTYSSGRSLNEADRFSLS
jgi:hypothetical protein